MKDRARSILEGAIREFIRTGHPVSSEHLFAAFDFGIRPAMIRWELQELSDAGYFFQNHPSGGRFPTNKAYRFFAQSLLGDQPWRSGTSLEGLARELLGGGPRALVAEIAEYLGVFSVGYAPRTDYVYESGLDDLVAGLDLADREELVKVMRDIALLPERIMAQREWWAEREWPRVFVGQGPLTRSERLSVVAGRVREKGEPLLLLAVGPTRMDYEKSLRLFRTLCDSM